MTAPAEQVRILLAMALCGAGAGAECDALAALCRALMRGRAAQNAADLLCGVLFAGGVVLGALLLRTEAFRWYTLLGALSGAALYRLSFGAAWRFAAQWLLRLWRKTHLQGGN